MAAQLGADSSQYLAPSTIGECIDSDAELCMACVTQKYWTDAGRELYQRSVAAHARVMVVV